MSKLMISLLAAAGIAFAGAAQAQTTGGAAPSTPSTKSSSADRKMKNADEDRIEADYKADKARCDSMNGNAKDVCQKEAKGKEKVAKAELEAEYKPSPRTNYDAAIARSKAAYATAKEECDEKRGAEETSCMKDAKASLARARAEAESARTANRAEEAAAAPRK